MKVTKINIDGTMTDINVSLTKTNILKTLEKNSSTKGSTKISELYNWTHENKLISCYGWYDGDAGFENKHDLKPGGNSTFCDEDSSDKLLFGDIFIVCFNKKTNKYEDYCVSDYGIFYGIMFEGFDDCESEEESVESDEPDTEDEEFIVKDEEDISEDEKYEYDSEEELDIDENDYSDSE